VITKLVAARNANSEIPSIHMSLSKFYVLVLKLVKYNNYQLIMYFKISETGLHIEANIIAPERFPTVAPLHDNSKRPNS